MAWPASEDECDDSASQCRTSKTGDGHQKTAERNRWEGEDCCSTGKDFCCPNVAAKHGSRLSQGPMMSSTYYPTGACPGHPDREEGVGMKFFPFRSSFQTLKSVPRFAIKKLIE